MKVLVISHGHPELSAGGAERASYSLFEHLKKVPEVAPIFIARALPSELGHDGWFGSFRGRKDEFLWAPPEFDWFRQVSTQPDLLLRQVQTIAKEFEPDIVHFHHYLFFGLDAVSFFSPLARRGIALTLHEYALICNHSGQMVKTGSLRLCHTASPAECSACFPEVSSGKFFLRERLIKQLISSVDAFVAPSHFLRDRYIAWGLRAEKIDPIENLLPPAFSQRIAGKRTGGNVSGSSRRTRFGYFGQINPYKGATVLLDALKHVSSDVLDRIEVVLFGARLELQPPEFQARLQEQMNESAARVSFFGSYRNEDVPALLQQVDWMVVPSIWWENSPLVIQEARAVGTPILASNIGGMAEKVRDGIDGLHFLAGSAMDCASKIERIARGDAAIDPSPLDVAVQNGEALAQHLNLYGRLARQEPIALAAATEEIA
jgi:glycosyltransferase involved in cell wall biosynthesis